MTVPILIYGQITESGSGVNAITVKCRNETTNELGTTTTDSNGLYVFDLSDTGSFPSGWTDNDQLTQYTIYKNFEGDNTITIDIPQYSYESNITLSAVTDSELIDYCTVQDVYDELDGKTTSDIAVDRMVKAIRRAEGLIDLKTNTSFKQITVTDEVHSRTRYNSEVSPDYLDSMNSITTLRNDNWFGSMVNNRVKTNYCPIVSITSLSYNTAGGSDTDSWTALTEQIGSSGDFIIADAENGVIDFLTTYPRIGKRSWKLTYVYGYNRDSTDRRVVTLLRVVERLTVLLAVKSILSSKSYGNSFDSGGSVTIGKISISSGSLSTSFDMKNLNNEINELWKQISELDIEVI